MSWIDRIADIRERAKRQGFARQEVIATFHQDPVAGYGLYQLLCDTDLLSERAQRALEPYVRNVEKRLSLPEDDWKVKLPMQYDPITDPEHDTLTYVIGCALRELHRDLPSAHDDVLIAQLRGINNTLHRHSFQTASISYEIEIRQISRMLIRRCGVTKKYRRPDRSTAIQLGDYFEVESLGQSQLYFDPAYLGERNLDEDDVVLVTEPWSNGYAAGRRQTGRSCYSRPWRIEDLERSIPKQDDLVIVHESEGTFRSVRAYFSSFVREFMDLIVIHDEDHSLDPTRYQPDPGNAA